MLLGLLAAEVAATTSDPVGWLVGSVPGGIIAAIVWWLQRDRINELKATNAQQWEIIEDLQRAAPQTITAMSRTAQALDATTEKAVTLADAVRIANQLNDMADLLQQVTKPGEKK